MILYLLIHDLLLTPQTIRIFYTRYILPLIIEYINIYAYSIINDITYYTYFTLLFYFFILVVYYQFQSY